LGEAASTVLDADRADGGVGWAEATIEDVEEALTFIEGDLIVDAAIGETGGSRPVLAGAPFDVEGAVRCSAGG
jgi:hypothetical protein